MLAPALDRDQDVHKLSGTLGNSAHHTSEITCGGRSRGFSGITELLVFGLLMPAVSIYREGVYPKTLFPSEHRVGTKELNLASPKHEAQTRV